MTILRPQKHPKSTPKGVYDTPDHVGSNRGAFGVLLRPANPLDHGVQGGHKLIFTIYPQLFPQRGMTFRRPPKHPKSTPKGVYDTLDHVGTHRGAFGVLLRPGDTVIHGVKGGQTIPLFRP